MLLQNDIFATPNLECVPEAKMPTECHSQREKLVVIKRLERTSKLEQYESFGAGSKSVSFVLEYKPLSKPK